MLTSRCVRLCRFVASANIRCNPADQPSPTPNITPHKLLFHPHQSCATQTYKYYNTGTAAPNPPNTAAPDPPDTAAPDRTNAAAGPGEEGEPDLEEIKSKILNYALDFVDVYGWSRKAIAQGCEVAGYPSVTEGMFENEGADLAMHFVKQSNQKLINYLQEKLEQQKESGEKLNVSLFIRDAIEYRLRLIIPYINVWPEAMHLLLSPKILGESTTELGHMIDDIWHLAGDRSHDFNWYTKRGMLAKLYGSTQLYMLRDQSPDFEDTWSFLDRRFSDLRTFGRVTKGINETCTNVYDVTVAGFNVLRNVAGLRRGE